MFSLASIMNLLCPALSSESQLAFSSAAADLANVFILLSIAFFFVFICLTTGISQIMSASAKPKEPAIVASSKLSLSDIIDSDLDQLDSDDLMEDIELDIIKCSETKTAVKVSGLKIQGSDSETVERVDDLAIQDSEPTENVSGLITKGSDSENEPAERVNDLMIQDSETAEPAKNVNINLETQVQSPKLRTITPLITEDYKLRDSDPLIQESTKKPFEYYLKWQLPVEEIECLTYTEKSQRFYHLTTFGECAEAKEAEPPEIILELERVEPVKEQETKFICAVPVIQTYKKPSPITQKNIPMNLLSDLIHQANQIDTCHFQMVLLKMNSIFVCSFLKEQKNALALKRSKVLGHLNAHYQTSTANYRKNPFISQQDQFQLIQEKAAAIKKAKDRLLIILITQFII